MIVTERHETRWGEVVFYENGGVDVHRHGGANSSLTEEEVETIIEHY